jgi:hypothetical protein
MSFVTLYYLPGAATQLLLPRVPTSANVATRPTLTVGCLYQEVLFTFHNGLFMKTQPHNQAGISSYAHQRFSDAARIQARKSARHENRVVIRVFWREAASTLRNCDDLLFPPTPQQTLNFPLKTRLA